MRIIEIVDDHGCPGEALVGNSLWLWGMLSHHNSISQKYAEQDSLYPSLRPKLLEGIQSGEMSPYDFAIIDEWYILVKFQRKEIAFGWVHFLAFDLFVGRWVYLDSRENVINAWIMAPVLFFCLMLGPIGLLLYLSVRLAYRKQQP